MLNELKNIFVKGDDVYYEKIYKIVKAAISKLGGGGIIFNIVYYIKNQYTEDKFYGLLLFIILIGFVLAFFTRFILPIIEDMLLEKTIDKLIKLIVTTEESDDKRYVKEQLGKIIDFQIANKLSYRNADDEKIKKIFEKLTR